MLSAVLSKLCKDYLFPNCSQVKTSMNMKGHVIPAKSGSPYKNWKGTIVTSHLFLSQVQGGFETA